MTTTTVRQTDIAFQATLYTSSNPTRAWLHNIRHAWIAQTLARLPLTDSAIGLDVGVGCGRYTRMLAARCARVVSIDINASFVAAVDRLPRVIGQQADIQRWHAPIPADVAICSEVLEHLSDTHAALSNLHRSLRPGGYLLLTTPHRWSTTELTARLLRVPGVPALARVIYREPVDELGHINLHTRRALIAAVQAAGFTVEARADLGLYLPVLGEFGGRPASRLFAWAAKRLAASERLSQMLWTQCLVLGREPC